MPPSPAPCALPAVDYCHLCVVSKRILRFSSGTLPWQFLGHSSSSLMLAGALSHSAEAFTFQCYSFLSLGPYPWHMEVPRLGVQSEL